MNLNEYQLDNDGNFESGFIDNSIYSSNGINVYFRDLEKHLISHINKADLVVGAVAWLTSESILDVLASVKNVQIVVQKEDFLRPDIYSRNNWKSKLRSKYDALKCNLTRYEFGNILSSASIASDPSIDAVRCVGNHNKDKAPAFPRMHNKFLIFARVQEIQGSFGHTHYKVTPYGVWTGSFNLTKNASMSLENALYITESDIVDAYFKEYGQIAAMSEKLDWTTDWAAPQWRIGT
ncbi:hypothetical protein [Vibrio metschnikovii]|uniref:hypothetical protein n=1 Tax=Vibrio metschnikovii TaxID=28172 RepID=UPI001C2F47F5|nr:hypothetical protein [Vibrio metschnikovii]